MPLVPILIVVIAVALIIYLLNSVLALPPQTIRILNVVLVVAVILWLLSLLP